MMGQVRVARQTVGISVSLASPALLPVIHCPLIQPLSTPPPYTSSVCCGCAGMALSSLPKAHLWFRDFPLPSAAASGEHERAPALHVTICVQQANGPSEETQLFMLVAYFVWFVFLYLQNFLNLVFFLFRLFFPFRSGRLQTYAPSNLTVTSQKMKSFP